MIGECVTSAYASVSPYIGRPEVSHALYRGIGPAMNSAAIGLGWGLMMLLGLGRHAWSNRRQIERRSRERRRTG